MKRAISLSALGCFLFLTAVVQAAPGDLDPDFGTGGILTVDITPGYDSVSDLAIQEDGKIVVAGQAGGITAVEDDFLLLRFLPDGSPDSTFGTDGVVTTDIFGSLDSAHAVALQGDGKIVVGGSAAIDLTMSAYEAVLVRYDADGTLDTDFGTGGIFTSDLFSAGDIAIQPDGKIVTVGGVWASMIDTDFLISRINSDGGGLDVSFDGDGSVTTDFSGTYDTPYGLALQEDGKIVVAGTSNNTSDFVLARYNPDGSLDDSFDSDGKVITDFGPGDQFIDLEIQTDGKIVAGGSTGSSGSTADFAVARYNTDGSLDTTFDGDGIVTTNFGSGGSGDAIYAISIQADGKILAAGGADVDESGAADFGLARYNPDGSLDATFGGDGLVTHDLQVGSGTDAIKAMGIQSDGRIVVAGTYNDAVSANIALAQRFIGNSSNLSLTKTADPATAAVGDEISYAIKVTNNGPNSAGDVTVTDDLPSGVSFESVVTTQGSCTGTEVITCNLGTMADGDSAEITIVVTLIDAGDVNNTATVTVAGQAVDEDVSNNVATFTVTSSPGGGGCQLVR